MPQTCRWPPPLDAAGHPRLAAWAARHPRPYGLLAGVYIGVAVLLIAYIVARSVAALGQAPAVVAYVLRWADATTAPFLAPLERKLAAPLAAWPAGDVLLALLLVVLLAVPLARWLWGSPAR
jgi:hypothetical protein